jgi:AhpD family alkylhydroperoxidase
MRIMKLLFAACLVAGVAIAPGALAQRAQPQTPAPPPPPQPPSGTQPQTGMQQGTQGPTATEAMTEIQQTFGFVPQFMRQIPDTLLPMFWMGMKQFEMNPNTSLDAKTKELIGVAVASQIPCEYCVYFHTQGARQQGATDQEIKEAVGMAGMTRLGSTLLNGMQLDKNQFRKDVDRVMKSEKRSTQARPSSTGTRTR